MERCSQCRKPFLSGEEVQRLPALQRAFMGQKSGQLGLYAHENYPPDQEDLLHRECLLAFLDPESNGHHFDEFRDQLRAEITEELTEVVREEFQEKFEKLKQRIRELGGAVTVCNECDDEIEDYTEPMCPWCKVEAFVWSRATTDGTFFECKWCKRIWNEDEEEVARAA